MEVKLVYQPDGHEYVLMEFQGDIECEEECSLNFMPIGQLELLEDKKYMMKIGIYDLVGVLTDLKDPILVNEKRHDDAGKLYILVRGICKSKILFGTRPTPILERALKKKKKPAERQSLTQQEAQQAAAL